MAMRVRGTKTVEEFIVFAQSQGATLHDIEVTLTNDQGDTFQHRYLKNGDLSVSIPGKDEDTLILHVEKVAYLTSRLGLKPDNLA